MKRILGVLAFAATIVAGFAPAAGAATTAKGPKAAEQTIIFSGGCFWGIQSVFEHTKGVTSAVSGYAGGWVDSPSYEQVSSGTTGHAESVKVTFDPSQVSLDQLFRIFFSVAHDPTQLNRQGPDVGTQYRSMVIYLNEDEHRAAKAYVDELAKNHVYPRPIVTQVVAYKSFFPAEAYHQHYAELHPNDLYIRYNDAPKVVALKKDFPQLYRDVK